MSRIARRRLSRARLSVAAICAAIALIVRPVLAQETAVLVAIDRGMRRLALL
ncbi:MAG: hypothetical protein ACRD2A_03665 [Vicinamibacterales bacterium]